MMELPRRHATPFKGKPVRTHSTGCSRRRARRAALRRSRDGL
jgi:hypothetical protein